jgi:uncharacterized protein (TIGR00730 family)
MNDAVKATPPTVCVYCGSRSGEKPAYAKSAHELGSAIGQRGWRLVYGGGKVGLMGIVADAVIAAGGQAIGVIPESLMRREVGHHGLHELHVVPNMHVRKQMMAERADAFVALPGGIGTLEELYEVWTWQQLGYHHKPIALLNVEGYYDALLQFMVKTVDEGFLAQAQHDVLIVETDVSRLLSRMKLGHGGHETGDYSRA